MSGVYYRAGVGIIVLNKNNHILICERSDRAGLWQLPQGGLEVGESQIEAMWRELKEETGLDQTHVELVGEYPDILGYDLPPELVSHPGQIGQAHKWYCVKIASTIEPQIIFDKEFIAYEWADEKRFQEISLQSRFKTNIYNKLSDHLKTLSAAG